MQAKTVEIRDRATFIPAIALRLDPACEEDRFLLARAGFGLSPEEQSSYVLLIKLTKAPHDPYGHDGTDRTMKTAHLFLREHFDDIQSGAVVDVEFILGEVSVPKKSERPA